MSPSTGDQSTDSTPAGASLSASESGSDQPISPGGRAFDSRTSFSQQDFAGSVSLLDSSRSRSSSACSSTGDVISIRFYKHAGDDVSCAGARGSRPGGSEDVDACVRELVDEMILRVVQRESIVRAENIRGGGGDVIDPVDIPGLEIQAAGPIIATQLSQNCPAEDLPRVPPPLLQPDQDRTSTTLPFGSRHLDEDNLSAAKAENVSDFPLSTGEVSEPRGPPQLEISARETESAASRSSLSACDDAAVIAKCLSDICDEVVASLDTREETIPSQDQNSVEHELKLSPIFRASSSNIAECVDSKELLNNIKYFVDNKLETNIVTQAVHHDNFAQEIKLETSTKIETGTQESNSSLVAQTDSNLPSLRSSDNICPTNAVGSIVNVAQSGLDDTTSNVSLNESEGSGHHESDSNAVFISECSSSNASGMTSTISENRSLQNTNTCEDGFENISEDEDFIDSYDLKHKTSATMSGDYTIANKLDVSGSAQNCLVSIADVTDSGLGTEASSQSDTELSNQHHTDSDNDFDVEHQANQQRNCSSLNITGSLVETDKCVQHNSNLLDSKMMGLSFTESKLPFRGSDPEVRNMCWQIVEDIVSEIGYPVREPELGISTMRIDSIVSGVPRVTCQIPLEKLTEVLNTYRKSNTCLGNLKSLSMPDLNVSSQSKETSLLQSDYSTSPVNKTNSCQEKSSISLSVLDASHNNTVPTRQATTSAVPETPLRTKITRTRQKCLKYVDEKQVVRKTKILRSHIEPNTPNSSSKPNEANSVTPSQNVNQSSVPTKPRITHPHKYTFQIEEENLMKLPGGEKLYACDICSGVYQRAFSLKRHYLRSHINYRHLTERDISNCGIVVNSNMAVSSADNTTIFMQNSKVISSAAGANTLESSLDNQPLGNQVSDCAPESIHPSTEDIPAVIKEAEKVDTLQDQVFDSSLKESITPNKETDVGSSKGRYCDKDGSGSCGDVVAVDSANSSDIIQSVSEVGDNTLDIRRNVVRSFPETYQRGSKLSGCNPRIQKSPYDAERPNSSPNVELPTTVVNPLHINGLSETGVTMPGLFRCHICGLCFDFKQDLKLHLANHPLASSGETQPYRCTTCQETFSFKSIFQRHLTTHNQPEPVAKMQLCLYCDKQFGTSGILNRHISRMHQPAPKRGKRRKLKVCPYCPDIFDKKFRNLRLLFKHLISEHSDIYHGCLECETRYENQISLDLHDQTVHGKNIRAVDVIASDGAHNDLLEASLDTDSNRNAPVLKESSITSATLINIDVNSGDATNPNNVEGSSFDTFQYSCAICQKMFTNYVNMCRHRRLAHGKAIAKSKRSDFTPKKYQKYDTKTSVSQRERSPKAAISEVGAQGSDTLVPELGIDPETLFYSKLSENIRDNLLNHLDGKIIMREMSYLVQGTVSADPKVLEESLEIHQSTTASSECDLNDAGGKETDKLSKVVNEKYNFPKKYETKGESDIYTNSYNKDMSCMDICTQITVKRNVERCNSKPSETCHDIESDKRSAEDQVSFLRLLEVNLGTNQLSKNMFHAVENASNEQNNHVSQLSLEPNTNVSKANVKLSTKSIQRRLSLRQRSTDSEIKEVIYEERLSNCVSDSDNEDTPNGRIPVLQTDKVSDVPTGNCSSVADAPNDLLPITVINTADLEENSNTRPSQSDASVPLADTSLQSHSRQEPVFVKLGPSSDSSDLSIQPLDAPDPLAPTEQKDPLEIVDSTAGGKDSLPTDQDQCVKVLEHNTDEDPLALPAPQEDTARGPRASRRGAFEFSGDWVRPRTYVCAACNSKFSDMYDLQDHKWSVHPNAWCSHYEFYDVHLQSGPSDTTGMSLELYKRFLKRRGALASAEVWAGDAGMTCTKCGKGFGLAAEFHRHLLDCGGDTTWMLTMFAASPGAGRRNRKWRPFGSRRRRHQGRRGMKRNIPNSPMKMSLQKTRRQNDADAIQRMIANLPAKRSTRRAIQFKEDEIKTRSQATINSNRLLRKRYKVTFASTFSRSSLKSRKERPLAQKIAITPILKADPPESEIKKSKLLRKAITSQLVEVQPQGAIPKKLTRKSLQVGETQKNVKKSHKVTIVEPEVSDGRKAPRRVRLIPDITSSAKNLPKHVEHLTESTKNVKKSQKVLFSTKLKKISTRKLTLLKPIVAKVPLNSESAKIPSKVNKKWIQTSINFPHRKRLLKSSSLKEGKEKKVKGKLPLNVKHPNRITRRSLEVCQSATSIQQTSSPKRMGRPPKTNAPIELADQLIASPASLPSAQDALAAAIGRKAGKDLAVSLKTKALARGVTLKAAKDKSNAFKSRTKKNLILKPSENVTTIPNEEVVIVVAPQVEEKEVVKEVVNEVVSVTKMNISETSDILAAMRKAMLESEPKDFSEDNNISESVNAPDQSKLMQKGISQEKRIKIINDKKQNAGLKLPIKPTKGLITCPKLSPPTVMVRTASLKSSSKLVDNTDAQSNTNGLIDILEDTSELDSLPLSIIALKGKLTRNRLTPTLDETTSKLKLRLQNSNNVAKGLKNSKVNPDLQDNDSSPLLSLNSNEDVAKNTKVGQSKDLTSAFVGKLRRIARNMPMHGLKTETLSGTSVNQISGSNNILTPNEIRLTAVADVVPKIRKTKLLLKSALLARTNNQNILRVQKTLLKDQDKSSAAAKGCTPPPADFSKEPIICTGCSTEFSNHAACDRHQKKCTYAQKTSETPQPIWDSFGEDVAIVKIVPKPGEIEGQITDVSKEVISCSSCHLEFKTRWGCERHERNCTILKDADPKAVFPSKLDVSSKTSIELSGDPPIFCPACRVEFNNHSACERHQRKCDVIQNSTNISEMRLGQTSSSDDTQMSIDHGKEFSSNRVSCFGCKRVFKGYVTCRKHQRNCLHISSHSKDSILKSKRFTGLGLLKLKTKCTTDEPSICTVCGLEFKTQAICLRHEKKCVPSLEDSTPPLSKVEAATDLTQAVLETSTGNHQIPLKCTVCNLKFRTKAGYSRHKRRCVTTQIITNLPAFAVIPPVESSSAADIIPNMVTDTDSRSATEGLDASLIKEADVVNKQTSKLLELLKPELTKVATVTSFSESISCSGCQSQFKTQAACDRHRRKCDSVLQLLKAPELCVTSLIDLAKNASTKGYIQPIVCKDCGSTFKNQSTCDRHRRKLHSSLHSSKAPEVNPEPSTELVCDQTTNDNTNTIICQDCGSTFRNQTILGRHRRKCGLTPQSSRTPGLSQEPNVEIVNNVSAQDNIQPIMCTDCGLEFKNHSACERHQKRCSVSVKEAEVLETQSQTSSGLEYPSIETNVSFVCSFCRLMFKSQPACDRHTKNCATILKESGTELCAQPHTGTSAPTVLKLSAKMVPSTQELEAPSLETVKSATKTQVNCNLCGLEFNGYAACLKHQKKCTSSVLPLNTSENGLDLAKAVLENGTLAKPILHNCNVCGLGFKGHIACLKHQKKCTTSAVPSSTPHNSMDVPQGLLSKSVSNTQVNCTVCGLGFQEHATCLKHQNKCSSLPSNLHLVGVDLADNLLEPVKSAKPMLYSCNICGLGFKVHTSYLKHQKKCVSISLPSNLPDITLDLSKEQSGNAKSAPNIQAICNVCGLVFKEHAACLEHQEHCGSATLPMPNASLNTTASPTPKLAANAHSEPIICAVCGLEFKSRIACRKHKMKCTLPPKNEDGSETKTKCAVEPQIPVLRNTKTSREAVVCSDCGLEFKSQMACVRHRRKCISFHKSRHMLKIKASGRKCVFPYFCHGCDKKFTYKGSFIRHRLTCIKLKSLEEGGSEENVQDTTPISIEKASIKGDHIRSVAASSEAEVGPKIKSLEVEIPQEEVEIPEDVPLALVIARQFKKSFKHVKKPLKRLQRPLRQLRKSPIVRDKTKSSVDGVRKSTRISIARISICNDKSDSEENMPELEIQEPIQNLTVVSPAKSSSYSSDIPILSPIGDLPSVVADDKLRESPKPILKAVEGLLSDGEGDSTTNVRTLSKSDQEKKSKTLAEKTDQQTSFSRSILMDILCRRTTKPTESPTSAKQFPNLSALLKTAQVTEKPSLLVNPPVLQSTPSNAKLDQSSKDKATIIPRQFPLNIPNPQPGLCILQSPIIARPIPPEPEIVEDLDEVLKINVIDVAQVRSTPEEKLKLQQMEAKLPFQDPKSDPEIEVKIQSLIIKHASRFTKKKSLKVKLKELQSKSSNPKSTSQTLTDDISSDVASSNSTVSDSTSALLPVDSFKGELGAVAAAGTRNITNSMNVGNVQSKRHSKRHLKKQKQQNSLEENITIKSNKLPNAKKAGFQKGKSVKITISKAKLSTDFKNTNTSINTTNLDVDYSDAGIKPSKQHATLVNADVQPSRMDSTDKHTRAGVHSPKLSFALLDGIVQPSKLDSGSPESVPKPLETTANSSKLRAALGDTDAKPSVVESTGPESIVKPVENVAKSSKLRSALGNVAKPSAVDRLSLESVKPKETLVESKLRTALGNTVAKPSETISSETIAEPVGTILKSSKLRAALRFTIAKPSEIDTSSSEAIVKPFKVCASLVGTTVKPSAVESISLDTVAKPSKVRGAGIDATVKPSAEESISLETVAKPSKVRGASIDATVKPSAVESISLETVAKPNKVRGASIDATVKPSAVESISLETVAKPSKVRGASIDATVKPSAVESVSLETVAKPSKVRGASIDATVKPSAVESISLETVAKPSKVRGASIDATVKPSAVESISLETVAKPSKVRGASIDATVKPSAVESISLETVVKPSKVRGASIDTTVKPSAVESISLETVAKPSKVRGASIDATVKPSAEESISLETVAKPSKVRGAGIDATVKPSAVESISLETVAKPSKVRGASIDATVKPSAVESISLETVAKPSKVRGASIDATVKPSAEESISLETVAKPSKVRGASIDATVKPSAVKSISLETVAKPSKVRGASIDATVKPSAVESISLETVANPSKVRSASIDTTVKPSAVESISLETVAKPSKVRGASIDATVKPSAVESISLETVAKPSKVRGASIDATVKPSAVESISLETVAKPSKVRGASIDTTVKPSAVESISLETVAKPSKVRSASIDTTVKPSAVESINLETVAKPSKVRGGSMDATVKPSAVESISLETVSKPSSVDGASIDATVKPSSVESISLETVAKPSKVRGCSIDATVKPSAVESISLETVAKPSKVRGASIDATVKPSAVESISLETVAKPSKVRGASIDVTVKPSAVESINLETVAKPSKVRGASIDATVKPSAVESISLETVVKPSKVRGASIDATVKPSAVKSKGLQTVVQPSKVRGASIDATVKPSAVESISLETIAKPSKVRGAIVKPSAVESISLETVAKPSKVRGASIDTTVKPSAVESISLETVVKPSKVRGASIDATVKPSAVKSKGLQTVVQPSKVRGASIDATVKPSAVESISLETVANPSKVRSASIDATVKPSAVESISLETVSKPSSVDGASIDATVKPSAVESISLETVAKPSKVRGCSIDATVKPSAVESISVETVVKPSKVRGGSIDATVKPSAVESMHIDRQVKPSILESISIVTEGKPVETIFEATKFRGTLVRPTKVDSRRLKSVVKKAKVDCGSLERSVMTIKSGADIHSAVQQSQVFDAPVDTEDRPSGVDNKRLKTTAKTTIVDGSASIKDPKALVAFVHRVVKPSNVDSFCLGTNSKSLETIVKPTNFHDGIVDTDSEPSRGDSICLIHAAKTSKLDSAPLQTTDETSKVCAGLIDPTVRKPMKDGGYLASEVKSGNAHFETVKTPSGSRNEIKDTSVHHDHVLNKTQVTANNSNKLEKAATPLALKYVERSNRKKSSPQQNVFEAFTYFKNAKPTVVVTNKPNNIEDSNSLDDSSRLTSSETCHDLSTQSVDTNTCSEPSSYVDMFTSIKFKRRAVQSSTKGRGRGGRLLGGSSTYLNEQPTPKKKTSIKHEETTLICISGEGCESNLNSDKDGKEFMLNKDADKLKPDPLSDAKMVGNKEKVYGTADQSKAIAVNKVKPNSKSIKKGPSRGGKVTSRGRSKQRTVNRGRKRSCSPVGRRTSLRSPVGRRKPSQSPVRRREGSVRRTRCYLSYEEMYTSDVASDDSSLDFLEPQNISPTKQVTTPDNVTKPVATPKNPLQKLASPSTHVENDPQPKIMIVEKFTYSKGPANDSKPSTEADSVKEHVVKDLSNPNRFRKEGDQVVDDCTSRPKEVGAVIDADSPVKEKKQRRRNLSLDTAYYCHICSKHYYSNYNLNKHKASTLHKYNVEKVDSDEEEGETPVEDANTRPACAEPSVAAPTPVAVAPSVISLPKNEEIVDENVNSVLQDLDTKPETYPIENNEVMINHAFGNYESVSYWLEQQTTHQNDYDWSENETSAPVDNLNWSSESLPSRLVDALPKEERDADGWEENRNDSAQNSQQLDNMGNLLDEVSLKELQKAMGVTDEEMMMLQHLGESNINSEWPLQEVQLTDLDNQKVGNTGGIGKMRANEDKSLVVRGENEPLVDKASDGPQMNSNADVVAEGLKSHMASALGKLLERALKNVYTPGGKLKTSPLNKPTLELLQKLSKLYSTKTGKTINKIKICEGANTGEPNRDQNTGNGKSLLAARSTIEKQKATDKNVRPSAESSALSEAVKVPGQKYACPICDVKFERKLSINYHIARAHRTGDKYIKHRKQRTAFTIKKKSKPVVKDTSEDDSVRDAPPSEAPGWLKRQDDESDSTASSIRLVSEVRGPREMPAIFTDDDVDYESPLEMLANQCFEIANRGLGCSEDSRMSTEVSEAQAFASRQNKERGRAKNKDSIPKIDSKNLEITKTKSKILQCVYLPSRKKAKLLGTDDGKPECSQKEKGIEAKESTTKSQKTAQSAINDIDVKEESQPMDTSVMNDTISSTTPLENTVGSENLKKKNKKSKFAGLNSDMEEDIRLKAEAALRDLNKRSRANQKLNWGALKFTKSNIQIHKTIGDPGRKSVKVDNIKTSPPAAADNSTTVGTSQVNKSRDLDREELLLEIAEEKPAVILDDKSAIVDVYEFEDDEAALPDLDLGFRHQNGVSPKASMDTPVKKTSKVVKVKQKTVKIYKKDLPTCPNSSEKIHKKPLDKKNLPKKQAKPKRQTDYFSQSVEEEWIPPKSAKDNFHEKHSEHDIPNAKLNVFTLNASDTSEELVKDRSKVKQCKDQSLSEATKMPTEKASQVNSTTILQSQKRKRKSSLSKTLPTEINPTDGEQETPKTTEEIPERTEDTPKTRRGRNHVCYTEIYDDIFSDMEEYDFINFDEEPTRKKVKKIAPKGKNKNDILSCVFGKGRRNSTITIGSDISDMDRECIAQAKSVDNDWDNGDELS